MAGKWGVWEEYWYDGLGRRVVKMSRQDDPHCDMTARCHSTIERYVWDGNQLLWEVKQDDQGDTKDPDDGPYSGNIGYIHGGDIDAPLAMMRNGDVIVLHQNWRGLFAFSTDEDGDYTTRTPNGGPLLPSVAWPAGNYVTFTNNRSKDTQHWYGSLAMDQHDATGLMYRRNRYYDGVTGQFTQTDPIGIAGGLNTYGYANGDPINFSDPFGLTPCYTLRCIFLGISRHILGTVGTSPEELETDLEAAMTLEPCTVATLSAGLTMVSDATTVAGVGAAVRAGALAYGTGRVATNFARNEVVRDLAPATIRQSSALAEESVEQGARAGLTHVGGAAAMNTASEASGTDTSVGDWVPVVASVNAVGRAQQACGR